jgi:hypothetical protein
MVCDIGQKNTRVLAAALTTLSKIGFDLFIEADSEKVTMRALNNSQSAFLAITMKARSGDGAGFFDHYKPPEENLRIKLTGEFLLDAFRSLKQVLSLQMSYDDSTATPCLQFEFSCEQGIRKTHRFEVTVETQTVEARFDKEDAGVLELEVEKFSQLLDHIARGDIARGEGMIVIAGRKSCQMGSFHFHQESQGTIKKNVSTEMNIREEEFEEYVYVGNVTLIFEIKEVKALLGISTIFGDSGMGGRPKIRILFKQNGDPINVAIVGGGGNGEDLVQGLSVNMILANMSIMTQEEEQVMLSSKQLQKARLMLAHADDDEEASLAVASSASSASSASGLAAPSSGQQLAAARLQIAQLQQQVEDVKPLLQAEVVDCTMVKAQAPVIEMSALPAADAATRKQQTEESSRKRSQLLGEQSQQLKKVKIEKEDVEEEKHDEGMYSAQFIDRQQSAIDRLKALCSGAGVSAEDISAAARTSS